MKAEKTEDELCPQISTYFHYYFECQLVSINWFLKIFVYIADESGTLQDLNLKPDSFLFVWNGAVVSSTIHINILGSDNDVHLYQQNNHNEMYLHFIIRDWIQWM